MRKLQKKELRRGQKRRMAAGGVIALVIFLTLAFYQNPVIREYKIGTEKFSEHQSIRLVFISDLHSSLYGKNQAVLIRMIRKQNPDLILLGGDIVDAEQSLADGELFLSGIQGIAPTYAVTGNHEHWRGDIGSIKEMYRQRHIKVLENTFEKIEIRGAYLLIGGVDDPEVIRYERPLEDWDSEIKNAFSDLEEEEAYKILLSHRPEKIGLYQTLPFDLILSGHTHGGQVRIPFFLNGLFAPDQGWFPPYAGGLYQHPQWIHIISRGASRSLKLPRVFNPPEVIVIDLLPGSPLHTDQDIAD